MLGSGGHPRIDVLGLSKSLLKLKQAENDVKRQKHSVPQMRQTLNFDISTLTSGFSGVLQPQHKL